MTLAGFGYLPDPRQDLASSYTENLAPYLVQVNAGDVDLRPFCTETNQYSMSSCAGNATADSVEILSALAGMLPVQLSRQFVYTLARNLMDSDGDGKGDIDKDDGTYIRLCFDVLAKFGICREDLPIGAGGWPYDITKVHVLPDIMAMRAATAHHIHSAYRILEQGDDKTDKVLEALRANHPVVFATQIGAELESLRGEGPVTIPKVALGGHAMIIVGHISGKGFIVKNSWGREFADQGFFFMAPEYVAWDRTQDLWVPTKGEMFKDR